jgi:heme-degrading monooxygenase HmoA
MFAVIFKATIATLDDEYHETALRMRTRAMDRYGCLAFESYVDGDRELSISYWKDEEQIAAWKRDEAHLKAQKLGRERWYRSYRIQVVELIREYGKSDG